MSEKIYVCTGAILKCSYGTSNGSFCATPKSISLCGKDQGNITDHISIVNIKPFGLCRSRKYPATAAATAAHHGHLTPMPCVPGTMTNWSIVDANSILAGKPAILNKAKLKCIFGGEITIINPGQSLETTEAKHVKVVNRDIVINDYFWIDKDGNECDTFSTNAMSSPTLGMQTSLPEGSQLVVNLGGHSYSVIVGKNGVAKVENVDVSEVSLDLPSTRKKSKVGTKPSEKTSPAPAPSPPSTSPSNPTTKDTPKTEVRGQTKPKVSFPETAKPEAPKRDTNKPGTPKPEAPKAPEPKPEAQKPAKAKPVDTSTVNTTTVPAPTSSGWGDPVANPKIRRNSTHHLYGKVRRDANGNPKNHQGFDYYAPEGTPILSVGDGVIYNIEKAHSSYGLNVTIRHTTGKDYIYSFYAHLSGLPEGIVKGKVVRKGEVIGYAGTSGNAKGFKGEDQHLHFECRTSPGHQLGFGGKLNPNTIVATKFTAQNIHGVKS